MPLIISMASFTLMQFADRVFLARYSAEAIQAALPAGILAFTLTAFFHALVGYAGTFVAQYHGAGSARECSRSTAQGFWLTLLSAPAIWALIPAGRWILRVSGHPPAVLAEELVYFDRLMAGGVLLVFCTALNAFFTGRGDTRTAMIASLAGHAVNIVLDYALIFGRLGFPRMGIAGAAWATIAGAAAHALLLGALYFAPRMARAYDTRRTLRWDGRRIRRIARFGLPSAAHMVLDVGAFAVFVLLTGRMGGMALTASNIALSVNNVAFQPLLGLHMAAAILVGQYQGRGESEIAARAGWSALKIGWLYMAAAAVSFLVFPAAYVGLFIGRDIAGPEGGALLAATRRLMVLMAAWGLFDAVNLILSGALKGAGDTRFVMLYSTVMGWGLWIPGELWIIWRLERIRAARGELPGWMFDGILPVWLWMTGFVLLLAIGFFLRFRSRRWTAIELIEPVAVILPPSVGPESPIRSE